MNWYLTSGKDSDVVLSSRIRIARNLKDISFNLKSNEKDYEQVMNLIEKALENMKLKTKLIRLKDIDDLTKMSLVEKHLVSPDFVLNKNEIGAIALNDEENICIMLNEEDHLRIQVLSSGFDLTSNLNLAYEIEEELSKKLNYAFSSKYGFLTSCPTNVGTGLRISVMVHLPAITATGNIQKILEIVNDFGMNIRGIYGEGTQSRGNVYQISNKTTLGLTEEEINKNLSIITEKIIEQERLARKYLTKNSIELEDEVYRSYGILSNAKKISSEECNRLLSDIRLGVDLGIIDLTDLKVNKLELYTKPANLQQYLGQVLDEYERDIARAKVIKDIIAED